MDRTKAFKKALAGLSTFASLIGAFVCALVVWEIILENAVNRNPGFTNHPLLGRINKPGIAVQSEEGFSRTKINSLGMRGEELSPKASNEYRILILGDSYTKAGHVADHKTYSYQLQKILRNKSNSNIPNIQAVNAGRDGSSPAYYIHLADFYKQLIKPDSVIIQLTDQDFTDDMLDPEKQFHVVKEENTFKIVYKKDFYSDNALSRAVLQKFPQLSFLLEYSVMRVGGENVQKSMAAQPEPAQASEPSLKDDPLNQYETVVDWTIQALKDKYPEVVVIYLPGYNNIKTKPAKIEVFLEKYTSKHGVHFVNMRRDFTEYYKMHHQPVYGFHNSGLGTGHINEIGHQLSAEALAKTFEEEILK